MTFLADTNIFLEILLQQNKLAVCKKFISEHIETVCISDFSIHSIGIILFKNNRDDVFSIFTKEFLPSIKILYLDQNKYAEIVEVHNKYNLDFDDSYQLCVAVENNLELVTMDKDFFKLKKHFKIKMI